jgi:Cas6b C-terminal domain/Cas6b N-terminal domain
MTTPLLTTRITFPEISLRVRDAHKLRGYFGNLFREHSPLLHNHLEDGRVLYKYPLVQYKVIGDVPTLVGFDEGARLLTELFLKISELDIDGRKYLVLAKNIEAKTMDIGLSDQLNIYRFETLWMALNQENYNLYNSYSFEQQQDQLRGIATQNILGFFSAFKLKLTPEQRVMVALKVQERETQFKNNRMTAFTGEIITNAILPDLAGIGKAVSRGYGTVRKV